MPQNGGRRYAAKKTREKGSPALLKRSLNEHRTKLSSVVISNTERRNAPHVHLNGLKRIGRTRFAPNRCEKGVGTRPTNRRLERKTHRYHTAMVIGMKAGGRD